MLAFLPNIFWFQHQLKRIRKAENQKEGRRILVPFQERDSLLMRNRDEEGSLLVRNRDEEGSLLFSYTQLCTTVHKNVWLHLDFSSDGMFLLFLFQRSFMNSPCLSLGQTSALLKP